MTRFLDDWARLEACYHSPDGDVWCDLYLPPAWLDMYPAAFWHALSVMSASITADLDRAYGPLNLSRVEWRVCP